MNFLLSFAFSLAVSGITHYHKRYGKYMGKTILDDNEETMLPEKECIRKGVLPRGYRIIMPGSCPILRDGSDRLNLYVDERMKVIDVIYD